MADVGKEVTSRALKLVHLGNVPRHHQPLPIAVGHHADLQMATVIELQIVRARKIPLFQIQRELGITQKVQDVLTIIIRPAQAQQLLREAITPEDCPFFCGQDHRVRQRLRTATKAFDQASQLTTALFVTHLHLVQAVE